MSLTDSILTYVPLLLIISHGIDFWRFSRKDADESKYDIRGMRSFWFALFVFLVWCGISLFNYVNQCSLKEQIYNELNAKPVDMQEIQDKYIELKYRPTNIYDAILELEKHDRITVVWNEPCTTALVEKGMKEFSVNIIKK